MVAMWFIGYGRDVANCNPIDINPGALDYERITRRPGEGRFDGVVPGAYGKLNLWTFGGRLGYGHGERAHGGYQRHTDQ